MSTDIALMMEEARTSETSVEIHLRTRLYMPEDSELHTRRRENLKVHLTMLYLHCYTTCARVTMEIVSNAFALLNTSQYKLSWSGK
jgi:hypothetical protein